MAPSENVPPKAQIDLDKKTLAERDSINDHKNDLEMTAIEPISSAKVGQSDVYTDAQYKKLTRKIDRYLIPIMFYMYGIQQCDKTAISVQALFGMREDTHLVGQQFQWLTTIFYITYLIGEFPSTWLLQRFQMGRVLTIYVIGWSICLLCISACQNWTQLMALRALQGFFECNVSPGFLLITGAWYRTEEHATRSLFWQSSQGFLYVVTNLMVYGIARAVDKAHGIAAWRVITLFLGSLTLLGGVFCYFILGSPNEVRWLTEEETKMAIARVADNQIGDESTSKKWRWAHVRECAKDPQVYLGVSHTFLACIPNGGITSFGTLLYGTFGFDEWDSMLFSLPRYAIFMAILIAGGIYVRRVQNHRLYLMMISNLIAFVGVLVLSLLPNIPANKWIKWAMFDLTAFFNLGLFLSWSLITSNIAGGTKRTFVSSLTLVAYCVGNMIGAQLFRTEQAPRYISGTVACSACFGLQVIVAIVWRLWYMYENKRRDRLAAESGLSTGEQQKRGKELGEQDTPDLANPHFRYTM